MEFLNEFGTIGGQGMHRCSPYESDEAEQIDCIVSEQQSFENLCMDIIKEEETKLCWLIAKIDHGNHIVNYYINVSNFGKCYIYSMTHVGVILFLQVPQIF